MYNYQAEKTRLFSPEGMIIILKARDNAKRLLKSAGAFNGTKIFDDLSVPDTFFMMAVLDYLVELGDISELTESDVAGQDRIFIP